MCPQTALRHPPVQLMQFYIVFSLGRSLYHRSCYYHIFPVKKQLIFVKKVHAMRNYGVYISYTWLIEQEGLSSCYCNPFQPLPAYKPCWTEWWEIQTETKGLYAQIQLQSHDICGATTLSYNNCRMTTYHLWMPRDITKIKEEWLSFTNSLLAFHSLYLV